jgi:hypothetical protein
MARRPHRLPARLLAAAIALVPTLVTMVLVAAPPAKAASFDVTTTTDGGAGSLRDAVASASASLEANQIVLQPGETYALDLCLEGVLDYTSTQPLTIVGNGSTIRQTCAGEGVIESSADITVQDATITGGDSPGLGGGIKADTADVTLVRSTVTGNRAATGGGIGAIRAVLVDSTVADNEASTGAGVWADQTLHATNSTISDNRASTAGGGVAVVNTSATLLFATVVGNAAPTGANVQLQQGADELVSFGTVFGLPAGGGADCDIDAGAATTSQGYNFSSDDSCGLGGGPGDLVAGGDPGLGALAANGGPTATRLPDTASPLLDAADCAAAPEAVVTDQRGVARPQGERCDIGAVEVEVDQPGPTPTSPPASTRPRFTG